MYPVPEAEVWTVFCLRQFLNERSNNDRLIKSAQKLIYFHVFSGQRRDGGCHFAAARPSDRPFGHASPAAHLPPQHHPLHRCDVHSAVNDRNYRSGYFSAGSSTQQVTTVTKGIVIGDMLVFVVMFSYLGL